MAKGKGKKKGKGKSKKSKGINTMRLGGMAGGLFADKKFLNEQLTKFIDDPKFRAVAKMAIGEFAPKQDFVRNIMKDQDILDGAGAALTVTGMSELMTEMGIAGMGAEAEDTDSLAIVMEGIDDIDEDEMNKDIDTVNEDVLGDDDDDMNGDIDTVNEDVLGDDDDDLY